ncbi:hypothetical protein F4604DRAFT_1941842 [Suillus subluteus]|nr:hypothetical protein F4604DRAFT_1941842 [Suillus subluteus]
MHMTVKNHMELQYALELGAQGLVQVPPRPPTVSIAECLRILTMKANGWSSFKLNVTKKLRLHSVSPPRSSSITHQQLGLPYIEVVSDHTLDTFDVVLDEETVVMFLYDEIPPRVIDGVPECVEENDHLDSCLHQGTTTSLLVHFALIPIRLSSSPSFDITFTKLLHSLNNETA